MSAVAARTAASSAIVSPVGAGSTPGEVERGPTLTPRRRALFAAAALALPWLVLLLLEIGLRMGGYGSSYPLFLPHPGHPEYLATNQRVGWRYFGNGAFMPTPELDLFRAHKQPGSYRIFMQGESSAQGYPYGHGGAPSRILEQQIQAAYPDREIEVVNTALTAVNSWTLLDQADEIIAQQPDAILIYTGHNEYYGAHGAGSPGAASRWRPLVKASLVIRHVRTAQLMSDVLARIGRAFRRAPDAGPRTVMQLMAGEQRIPYKSARYQAGLEQFRANLGALLARYRAHGIPVLIGTVASNERDMPPLLSGLAAGTDSTAWIQSYRRGTDALERGDSAAALEAFEATMHLDTTSAAAWYALGQLHAARGDTAEARVALHAAKDRDQLPFRAPEAINAIIREEAARHGATVVETQRALEQETPGGIVGRSLMLEHLHPNLDGYFIIASAFRDALQQPGMLGAPASPTPPSAEGRARIPVTPIDSLIGLLRTDRLVSGWPFQPRGAERIPIVDTLHASTQVQQLAQAVVVGNLPWPEATERLRDATERSGDYEQSIRAARALALEYSYSAEPYMDAARVAMLQHHDDDALRYVVAANSRQETPNSAQLAGLLLLRRGDHDAALPYLRRAAALAPGDKRIALSLGAAEAIPAMEQRRAKAPRDTTLLYDLGGAYALTQQYEKSRDALTQLLRIAPRHAGARSLLAKLPE